MHIPILRNVSFKLCGFCEQNSHYKIEAKIAERTSENNPVSKQALWLV